MIKLTKEQKELIENNVLAFATSSAQATPNCIAIACCKVINDKRILITDNFFNKTQKNLLNNPSAAIAVWNKAGNVGFQFIGKTQYITKGKFKDIVDRNPDNKGLAHKAAVLFDIKEIWDLASPKLLQTNE